MALLQCPRHISTGTVHIRVDSILALIFITQQHATSQPNLDTLDEQFLELEAVSDR